MTPARQRQPCFAHGCCAGSFGRELSSRRVPGSGRWQRRPKAPAQVHDELVKYVRPDPMGDIHPRFRAWFMDEGNFTGALGDFLLLGAQIRVELD